MVYGLTDEEAIKTMGPQILSGELEKRVEELIEKHYING